MVSEVDRKDPHAIPNYLEKHFKQKAALKKQREMMGESTEDMQSKIEEMDSKQNKKFVDVNTLKAKRSKAMEQYI